MTTSPRVRQPSGARQPGARQSQGARPGGRRNAGNFGRRRRGRNVLKAEEIDYKDVQLMRRFVNERGKLLSGRRIGVTAKNQRRLARAIKRAQHLALIPMAPNHTYVTGGVQTNTPASRNAEAEEAANGEQQQASATDQSTATQSEAPAAETGAETAEPAPANGAAPASESNSEQSA